MNTIKPLPIIKEALRLVDSKSDLVALDLGAGRGRNTVFLAKNGYFVDAVDKSQQFLESLKQYAESEDVAAKINVYLDDLSVFSTNRQYDLIIMTNVLHLLNNNTQSLIMKKIPMMLKKNGVLAISHILDQSSPDEIQIKNAFSDLKMVENELKTVEDGPHPGTSYPHRHRMAYFIFKK